MQPWGDCNFGVVIIITANLCYSARKLEGGWTLTRPPPVGNSLGIYWTNHNEHGCISLHDPGCLNLRFDHGAQRHPFFQCHSYCRHHTQMRPVWINHNFLGQSQLSLSCSQSETSGSDRNFFRLFSTSLRPVSTLLGCKSSMIPRLKSTEPWQGQQKMVVARAKDQNTSRPHPRFFRQSHACVFRAYPPVSKHGKAKVPHFQLIFLSVFGRCSIPILDYQRLSQIRSQPIAISPTRQPPLPSAEVPRLSCRNSLMRMTFPWCHWSCADVVLRNTSPSISAAPEWGCTVATLGKIPHRGAGQKQCKKHASDETYETTTHSQLDPHGNFDIDAKSMAHLNQQLFLHHQLHLLLSLAVVAPVGHPVGHPVGCPVGCTVGCPVGCPVGRPVGRRPRPAAVEFGGQVRYGGKVQEKCGGQIVAQPFAQPFNWRMAPRSAERTLNTSTKRGILVPSVINEFAGDSISGVCHLLDWCQSTKQCVGLLATGPSPNKVHIDPMHQERNKHSRNATNKHDTKLTNSQQPKLEIW